MTNAMSETGTMPRARAFWLTALIVAALGALMALFAWADGAYFRYADARFPHVGTSAWLATLWGVVSRAHLILVMVPFVLWRPRLFGFRIGQTRQHWRMLLVMLFANCGVIATYLWLTRSTTPYSGNQWLVTEVITVPLVEEAFWRGLVLTLLLLALRRIYPENTSNRLAAWFSGVAFGLLHAANAMAGVPLPFVALQTLNAAIWGVVYGFARTETGSVYPAMLLHAAMNLVVILF